MGAPVGLLDDIPKLSVSEGELRFALEAKFRKDHPAEKGLYWARLEDGKLKGTFEIEGDPSTYLEWTGMRAPAMPEKDDGTWKRGDPVALFNGRDLSGWQPVPPGHLVGWVVRDGALTALPGAPDLVSDKKFMNFVVDAEYRIEPHTNSGIVLRGRYEVQILDDFGQPPDTHGNGALYSRILPTMNASKPAGEWQSYDIRLVGRDVTVVLNDHKIIDRKHIDGLTAIAQNADEGEPGPIILQGDHKHVEIRKVVLTPLTH